MDDDFFGRRFGPGPGRGAFHSDFDSFFFGDFNRIFQGMDDMMRQFTLGNFSMIEGPNQAPPAIEAPSNPKNLRDNFLKDHPNNPEHEKSSSSFIFPNHPVQDRFGNHSHPSKYDEDLDVKIEREGLDKVLREDLFREGNHHHNHNYHHQYHHQPQHPHPHHHHHQRAFNAPPFDTTPGFFGGGQACSIRRIQRPDGSIEEVKTVRGTDGKEEKTVTRIIGDKAHSVIEKKANNQVQETEEIFHNFDEDKLDEFNRMWNNFPSSSSSPTDKTQKPSSNGPIMAIKDKEIEKPTPLPIESNVSVKTSEKSPSIFSKIMSWLKK